MLVVEDEALIGLLIEEELLGAGARVIGVEATLRGALRCLREAAPGLVDAAVVDLNLNGELAYPVTEILTARGIPFVITTGYDDVTSASDAPVIPKPFNPSNLVETLADLLNPGSGGSGGEESAGHAAG